MQVSVCQGVGEISSNTLRSRSGTHTPTRRILKPFTVVNRFHFSAAPFGAQVIQVRYQTETVVFEWQIPIRVQQVRLVVIDKIFDAHIPVALPPGRYVALVPKGIAEIAE